MDRKTEKALLKQGFVELKPNKHRRFVSPRGQLLVVSSTPGRGRSEANLRATIVRMGYEPDAQKTGSRQRRR